MRLDHIHITDDIIMVECTITALYNFNHNTPQQTIPEINANKKKKKNLMKVEFWVCLMQTNPRTMYVLYARSELIHLHLNTYCTHTHGL